MINTEIVLWAPLRFWHGATRGLNPALLMTLTLRGTPPPHSPTRLEAFDVSPTVPHHKQQVLMLMISVLQIFCVLAGYSKFNLQCFDAVGWAAGRASGL